MINALTTWYFLPRIFSHCFFIRSCSVSIELSLVRTQCIAWNALFAVASGCECFVYLHLCCMAMRLLLLVCLCVYLHFSIKFATTSITIKCICIYLRYSASRVCTNSICATLRIDVPNAIHSHSIQRHCFRSYWKSIRIFAREREREKNKQTKTTHNKPITDFNIASEMIQC